MEIDSLRTVRSQVASGPSGVERPVARWRFHPRVPARSVVAGAEEDLVELLIVRFVEYMLRCSPEEFTAPEVARVYDYQQ